MKKFWNLLFKSLGVMLIILIIAATAAYFYIFEQTPKYHPVQDPLVKEKLDDWQDRKFGLFMHWGPYSQWGVVESWSICAEDEAWCARDSNNYTGYKKDYETLKTTFNPTSFDAKKWAKAAKNAGMKYMVFTTKHHDGFCMFDTETTDYKITSADCRFSQDPRADVTKEIFTAFRNEGFMVGPYFSKPDWNSEYFWWPYFSTPDRNVNYDIKKHPERWQKFVEFSHTQIDELMSNYGELDILWLDGGWVRPLTGIESALSNNINDLFMGQGYTQLKPPQNQDMDMAGMAKKARARQPGLIVVDRHVEGSYQNYLTPEQYVPKEFMSDPWESCITMGGAWSYCFNENYKPARLIIHTLVDVVSKGGNLLLNIGPGPDGEWHEEAYRRLEEIGNWMQVNGKAIYATKGMKNNKEGQMRFTKSKDGSVNAIFLTNEEDTGLPPELLISQISPAKNATVNLLGHGELKWEKTGKGLTIFIPERVKKAPPCEHAWSFRISAVK